MNISPTRTCPTCGEVFTPLRPTHRYCDASCYRGRAPKQPLSPRSCETCGQVFTPDKPDRRYCRRECYVASFRDSRQGVGPLGRFLADQMAHPSQSQVKLAARVGIAVETLTRLLHGKTAVPAPTRAKLRATFGAAIPLPKRPPRICATCRRPFVPRRPMRRHAFCSRACVPAPGRRPRIAKTPLAQFLFGVWRDSGRSRTAYARALGLSSGGFTGLLGGKLPLDATLARLREHFGEQLPPTDTHSARLRRIPKEVRRERIKRAYAAEAARKSARSRAGLKQSQETITKRLRTQRATGGLERMRDALVRARTPRNRCLAVLGRHLQITPRPSRKQIDQWAAALGDKIGLDMNQVLAAWRPTLKRRGLVARGGRPSLEDRHRRIALLMKEARRTVSGRLPEGFWPAALTALDAIGKADSLSDHEMLRKWYVQHRRTCPHRYLGEEPSLPAKPVGAAEQAS